MKLNKLYFNNHWENYHFYYSKIGYGIFFSWRDNEIQINAINGYHLIDNTNIYISF